jgi:hypothetical protein
MILSGGALGSGGDIFASISHAGETIGACGSAGFPLFGTKCFGGGGSFLLGPAVLPAFQGDPTLRIGGSFSIFLDVSFFEFTPGMFPPTAFLHDTFSGTGTTVYDIVWQPQTETWLLVHSEGRIPEGIPEVPEPSTLILFGSTAAALVYRWRRRTQLDSGKGS